MQTVVVVVNNPGNLSSASQLGRVWQLVKAYESASFAYGNQSTVFWLNSYIKFMAFYDGNGEEEVDSQFFSILKKEKIFSVAARDARAVLLP